MAKRSIKDSVAVITGASSGIGRALAVQLSGLGSHVVLNARRIERLQALKIEIEQTGGQATLIPGDITDAKIQNQICQLCEQDLGRIDILINNAGVGAVGRFAEASVDRMRKIMELNFFATIELTHLAIPLLRKSDNAIIVNISSVLGHRAVPLKSEYCASKFAVHGFSDSLRAELESEGIDVLLVSPSTTGSEFFDSVLEDQSGKSPKLGQPMPPEKVARLTIKAIQRGKNEIILSFGGKALVWLDRACPPLANYFVKRFAQ